MQLASLAAATNTAAIDKRGKKTRGGMHNNIITLLPN